MKDRICVIAVGYNRPDAMLRLLNSLGEADYLGDNVDLLISIDKGQKQEEIVALAQEFCWKYGEKVVRAFPEKQGLRNHILQCGDVSMDYKAVVVLEDDLTVARNFYSYVRSCVDYYGSDKTIAGISLYKHCFNVDAGAFFEPVFDGTDVFLMQYAQSWGQCWTPRMWEDFKHWYKKNSGIFDDADPERLEQFPHNISTWSKQSWLKYYIAYVIENDLYYVYPHVSVTTNHSEAGEHNQLPNCDYQVALPQGVFGYRLKKSEDLIKYDAFFERKNLIISQFKNKKVILDLYGRKSVFNDADILISTASRPYKILYEWKLKLRPQEMSCLAPEEGKGIRVYDLHVTDNPKKSTDNSIRTRFDVKGTSYRRLIELGFAELRQSGKNKIRKALKR